MDFVKKNISLLNIDIDGFSKIYRALGDEMTAKAMNVFYSILADIATNHHGTVVEFLGDGFICLFDTPETCSVDAVKSAVEMRKELIELHKVSNIEGCEDVKAAIVITSGESILGTFGKDDYEKFNTIGDPVNSSFSISHNTVGGQLLIDQNTFNATSDIISEYEEIKIPRRHHDTFNLCYNVKSLYD